MTLLNKGREEEEEKEKEEGGRGGKHLALEVNRVVWVVREGGGVSFALAWPLWW
jgi:hypothetical protein